MPAAVVATIAIMGRLIESLRIVLPAAGVTAGTVALSGAVAEALAWAVGVETGWRDAVVALLVPAAATPAWAVPLLRANLRLKRRAQELDRLAQSDPLTGLANRRAFFERAQRILDAADAAGRPGAVMLIDVDRFRAVNDELGRDVGDTVLCAVAATMAGTLTGIATSDRVLARIGGDEFALVIGAIEGEQAEALAALICARVRAIVCAPTGVTVAPTVSVGLAMRAEGEDPALALRAADRAACAARRRGGDRWCLARNRGGEDGGLRRAPAHVAPVSGGMAFPPNGAAGPYRLQLR
jgi:diguanylate cyclase (GGDEF)-like protein